MNRLIALIAIIVFFCAAAPLSVRAQQSSADACRDAVATLLAEEHARYRQALFGSTGSVIPPPSDASSSSSASEEGEEEESPALLRTGGVVPESKRGIFETRERLTSELIEPLVESYRTFRCRSYGVCELMAASFGGGSSQVQVGPIGCEPFERYPFAECALNGNAATRDVASLEQFCARAVNETLGFERRVLHLAVAYDAGYRALLQFTGVFDAFLTEVPLRTFTVLRQMIGLLGRLHQVPCFTAHCDLPPMEEVPPDIVP